MNKKKKTANKKHRKTKARVKALRVASLLKANKKITKPEPFADKTEEKVIPKKTAAKKTTAKKTTAKKTAAKKTTAKKTATKKTATKKTTAKKKK